MRVLAMTSAGSQRSMILSAVGKTESSLRCHKEQLFRAKFVFFMTATHECLESQTLGEKSLARKVSLLPGQAKDATLPESADHKSLGEGFSS